MISPFTKALRNSYHNVYVELCVAFASAFFFFLVGEGETCTEVVFAVQETFPPLRHYFTSNLFMCTPLCSLTRNCGEHLTHWTLKGRVEIVERIGQREWMTKVPYF